MIKSKIVIWNHSSPTSSNASSSYALDAFILVVNWQAKQREHRLQIIWLVQPYQLADIEHLWCRSGRNLMDDSLDLISFFNDIFFMASDLVQVWPVLMGRSLSMSVYLEIRGLVVRDLDCWGSSNQCDQAVNLHRFFFACFFKL